MSNFHTAVPILVLCMTGGILTAHTIIDLHPDIDLAEYCSLQYLDASKECELKVPGRNTSEKHESEIQPKSSTNFCYQFLLFFDITSAIITIEN